MKRVWLMGFLVCYLDRAAPGAEHLSTLGGRPGMGATRPLLTAPGASPSLPARVGRDLGDWAVRAAHLLRPRSDDGLDHYPWHHLRRHHLGQARPRDRRAHWGGGDGRQQRALPEP